MKYLVVAMVSALLGFALASVAARAVYLAPQEQMPTLCDTWAAPYAFWQVNPAPPIPAGVYPEGKRK